MHECIELLVHHDDTPVLRIPTMISFERARSSARQSTGLLTPAALLLRVETRWPRVQIPSSPLISSHCRMWHRWTAHGDPLISCPSDSDIDASCRGALMPRPSGGGIDEDRFWQFPLRHNSVEGFR